MHMKLSSYHHLVKEWHPTKNGKLTPNDFTHGSKKKVWWLCPNGHSYEAKSNSRVAGKTGCPYCSGRKVSKDNNLQVNYPEIAREWHPAKNNDLTPKDVTFGSSKKVWWLCDNGHAFSSSVNRRTSMRTSCPYCQGRAVGDDNNLMATHPSIAKEWDELKNKKLHPSNVTYGSKKKVWWLCPKGHSYQMVIKNRTIQNQSCPKCTKQSSEQEVRILSELKWVFKGVKSRYKFDGKEVDVFLPSINIGIEFDGSYWHKDKKDSDTEKDKYLASKGIQIIRVRQYPLEAISKNDIIVSNKQLSKTDIDDILKRINLISENNNQSKIDEYLSKKSFVNEEVFREYKSYFPSPLPEHSLAKLHPLTSSEWDKEKNHPIVPSGFTPGSSYKVWWLCPKGHGYEAVIANRTRGTGCPYCSGRKTNKENSLLMTHPSVASEWDNIKNGNLTSSDVTYGSEKKAYWLCPKGHSYLSSVKTRVKSTNLGCPYCNGKKTSKENSLQVVFPEIAMEWHPTKNGKFTPVGVTRASDKKVWWICQKGHSYEAVVKNRTINKSGCPYCAGKRSFTDDLFY